MPAKPFYVSLPEETFAQLVVGQAPLDSLIANVDWRLHRAMVLDDQMRRDRVVLRAVVDRSRCRRSPSAPSTRQPT